MGVEYYPFPNGATSRTAEHEEEGLWVIASSLVWVMDILAFMIK